MLYSIHPFQIEIDNGIRITNDNKTVLKTTRDFLSAGHIEINRDLIVSGNYNDRMRVLHRTDRVNISDVSYEADTLVMHGYLWSNQWTASYSITFYMILNQLAFDLNVTEIKGTINKIWFSYECGKDETFHGFGTQYTYWNMKGRRVPIIVSEQGVGRGKQPLSTIVNALEKNAAGFWGNIYLLVN